MQPRGARGVNTARWNYARSPPLTSSPNCPRGPRTRARATTCDRQNTGRQNTKSKTNSTAGVDWPTHPAASSRPQ
eukprot:11176324-Lingulodinium_polyedra.AAC.1